MTDLSEAEREEVERRSRKFVEELQEASPDLLPEALKVGSPTANTAFFELYAERLGNTANSKATNATQTLLQEDSNPSASALQSAGTAGKPLGYFHS